MQSSALAKRIAGGLHIVMGLLLSADGLWRGDWLTSFVGAFFAAGGVMYNTGVETLLPKWLKEKLPEPTTKTWDSQQAGSVMYDAGSFLLLIDGIQKGDSFLIGAAITYIVGNNLLKIRNVEPGMEERAI
jgi:hypothetical protein